MIPSSATPTSCSLGDAEVTLEVVYIGPDSVKLYFSSNLPTLLPSFRQEAFPKLQTYQTNQHGLDGIEESKKMVVRGN